MWTPVEWLRRFARGERDFADEIGAHLSIETDRLVAEGWPPESARLEAPLRFGNVGAVQERYHDARTASWAEDAGRDIRYAIRSLARDRVYVLAAVGALGLGLAANIALFSLFSAIALKPLPVPAPGRIVSISRVTSRIPLGPFSLADYLFYRDNNRSFTSLAGDQPSHLRLAGIAPGPSAAAAPAAPGAIAEPVIALFVSANYFETFGVHPIAGRGFRPDDDAAAGSFSGLISDNYWQRRFARDPSVIGETFIVSGIRVNIIGVAPRDFAALRQEVPDLWVTLAALGDVRQRALKESNACCELAGFLKPGVSVQQAQADMASLAAVRRRDLPPSEQRMSVSVVPGVAFGRIGTLVRPLFIALQVAMLLVLLIACGNVAGLFLGRAAVRQRELAVRLATGASRARLVRQLVTEGVVVAIVAGLIATSVTVYSLGVGARLAAGLLSKQGGGTLALEITPDARVLVYVAIISILAGVAFALAPALQASRPDLVSALKSVAGGSGGSARGGRLRGWLIAGQIAVSVGLLTTAGGLARSAIELLGVDPGFRSDSLTTVWLTNPEEISVAAPRARAIEATVRERLAALSGVRSVAVASRLPLGGNVVTSAMLGEDRAGDPANRDAAIHWPYAFVSGNYFETMGIRLLHGRTFTAQEVRDSAKVAVISDSMARILWPNGDALGKRLVLGAARETGFTTGSGQPSGSAEVIGIVRDVHGIGIAAADIGDAYLPRLTNGWSSRLVIRYSGDVNRIARDIPRMVQEVEPALPVSVQPMSDVVAADPGTVTARLGAAILALVGTLGLLLAAVGVYGMVSYAVRQQRRDIGIRMALGAQPRQVLASAIRATTRWIAGGVIAGALIGAAGIQLTNAVLVGAAIRGRVLDPAVMLGLPVTIAALAIVAAALSGRKATRFDPAQILRADC